MVGIWRDSSRWRSLDRAKYGGIEEEVTLFSCYFMLF